MIKETIKMIRGFGMTNIIYVEENDYIISQDPLTRSSITFHAGMSLLDICRKIDNSRERFEIDNLRRRAYKRMEDNPLWQ